MARSAPESLSADQLFSRCDPDTLGFDDKFNAEADSRYEFHGVDVVVDKKSALFLDGTTVDWYDGLDKRGFTFDNPNAVKTCGCGSSFQA